MSEYNSDMAFKATPEAFDAFDQLDQDSKAGVLKSMSFADQTAFITAYEKARAQPAQPSVMDRVTKGFADSSVGTYKDVVGLPKTPEEEAAQRGGAGGIMGLINPLYGAAAEVARLLPRGSNAARLIAGDVMQTLDPVLGYINATPGGEQRLGIADAQGTIVPEVAKAANQLPENNAAAAVVRFVPQAAANLVGDTGVAAMVGAKALGLLGKEAGPLARAGAAVAGSASENLGQEALGSFIGGEEGAVSQRLKDVITDPFSVALMTMPGLLAMRRVKPGIAVETPDLRDPKLIMQEGGDVHRSIAPPEELEATAQYKGEPKTDLNPVKTEPGKRKLGERPPTQDSEFDKRVNQVMSLAEAREGKLRTQISEIPGPIAEAAEAAARAEYIRVAADDSQPIVAAAAAADRARERVMREWLGVPPLKPTDADVAGLNWDSLGDSPRDRQGTVNMRAPGAQQDTIPGRNGRPYLGEATTPGRGMYDAPTQVNALAKRALEGEVLRDPVTDPRIDPTFVGKVVEGEIAKPRKLLGAGEVIESTVKRKLGGVEMEPTAKTPAVREQMSRAEVKRLLTAETVVGPDWQGRPDAIPSARAAKDRQARAAKLHAVDPLTGRPFEPRTPSLPGGERTRAGGPPFKSIVLPEGKALRNAQRGTLFFLDERGKVREAPLWESANEGASVNVKSPAMERYLELNSKGSGPGGPGGPPIDNLTRPPEFGPGHRGLDAASSLKARVEKDSAGLQAFFRDLQAQVSIPPNYAARDVAPYLHEAKAAGAMHKAAFEKNALKLNEAWKALTPAQRASWESVIKRIQNNEQVAWTEVPEPVRALTKHYVEGMHKQVHMLSAAGYFTPEQSRLFAQRAAEGHVPLARDYEIFFKGKKFRADVSAYSQALDYLQSRGKSADEAAGVIRQVMDAYYNRRRQGRADAKIGSAETAKARTDLEAAVAKVMGEKAVPPQMRALFGEISDPRFVVAMNAAELERMTRQYAWTKAFVEELPEGQAWVSSANYDKMPLAQKAKFHPQMIGLEGASPTANKQLYGELAGKYVTRDVWEALNGAAATKLNNVVFDTLGKFQLWFRAAKTLFSPLSFVRNYLSNTASSAAGGLPVWDPRFYKQQVQSLRAHLDYRKSLSLNDARTGEAKWIVKAMEDNAIPPGRGQDIIDGDAVKVLEDIIQRDSKSGFLGLADQLFKAASTGKMKLASIYELMDSVPRLAVYRFQVERGMSNGLSERAARQRASSIVNRYFASSANLGPAMQQISKLPFFGPFMGWAADNVRVHKNIMTDTARALAGQGSQTLNPASGEGFGPMVNTLLHKALFLGALGAGARAMFGVSDQEAADARAALSPTWKADHPFYDVITVPGADGQLYAISLDTFDPTATFMRGTDHPVTRVMGNILKTLSDGGLLEGAVDTLVPFGARPQQRRETMPGEELDSVAQRAWDYLAPGVLTQWQSAMRKLETPALNVRPGEPWMTREPLRQGEEPLSLMEAFNRYINPVTAPFLAEKIGSRNATATRKRESSEVRGTQNLPKKIGQNPNLSPLQKEKYKLGARQKVNELKSK